MCEENSFKLTLPVLNIHRIFAVLSLDDTKSCQCACMKSTVRNFSIGRDMTPVFSNSRPIRIEDTDVFGNRQKYCGYMLGYMIKYGCKRN